MSVTNRILPSIISDGGFSTLRTDRYGDLDVQSVTQTNHPLVDEGAYFTACNPTISTPITQSIVATWVATTPLMTIYNSASTGGVRLFFHYLRMIYAVAPASATSAQFAIHIDNIQRFSSGGSALTPKNCNMGSTIASAATVNFGALTATAASSSVRQISRGSLRTAIPAVLDQFEIRAGAESCGSVIGSGAGPLLVSVGIPPIAIDPGHTLVLYVWYPSNAATAATTEVETGWYER